MTIAANENRAPDAKREQTVGDVRDRSLPSLYGRYLFGDYCRSQIESVRLSRGGATGLRATGLNVSKRSSFGEDAQGHICIASLTGPVYRITNG